MYGSHVVYPYPCRATGVQSVDPAQVMRGAPVRAPPVSRPGLTNRCTRSYAFDHLKNEFPGSAYNISKREQGSVSRVPGGNITFQYCLHFLQHAPHVVTRCCAFPAPAKNAPQVVTSCVACFVADHKMPQDATSCSVCRAAMATSCHKMSQVVSTPTRCGAFPAPAKNAPQVVTSCVACFVADHKMPQDVTSCSVCRAAMATSCHKMSQVVHTLFSDGNTTAYWSQHVT
eukprot:gene8424-biopygen9167